MILLKILNIKKNISFLKKQIKNGGLEKNIEKYILKNNFACCVCLVPKKNYNPYLKIDKFLEELNSSKDDKKISKINYDILEFKKYQNQEQKSEVEDKISAVSAKSFPKKIEKSKVLKSIDGDVKKYFKKIDNKNISVNSFVFNAGSIEKEDIGFLSFLSNIFPELSPKCKDEDIFLENLFEKINGFYTNISVCKNKKEKKRNIFYC